MDQPGQSTGQNRGNQGGGQNRLQQTQQQVDDVMGIMKLNLEKVLEREEKLSELDDRMEELNKGAYQFEQHAVKLKRKFWWQNLKMKIIIGVIVSVFLIIILVWIFSGGDSSYSSTTPAVTP